MVQSCSLGAILPQKDGGNIGLKKRCLSGYRRGSNYSQLQNSL